MANLKYPQKALAEIGPLLDAWDQLPNDVKQEIDELAPELYKAMLRLYRAIEF